MNADWRPFRTSDTAALVPPRAQHLRKRLIVVAALCLLCRILQSDALAEAFDVVGTLHYSVHPESPNRATTREFIFKVEVRDCDWRIRTETRDGLKAVEVVLRAGALYTTCLSVRPKPGGGYATNQSADVEFREIPRDDGSNIGYLWLAYGSRCYFDAQNTNRLRPIWILDDRSLEDQDFTVPAVWTRASGEILPGTVVYFNDGWRRTRSQQGSSIAKWPAPFDQGFTNAVHEVLARTNVEDVVIPTEFLFTRYGIEPVQPGHYEIRVITRTAARATTVLAAHRAEPANPELRGSVRVVDRRFAQSNPSLSELRYSVSNGTWPDSGSLQRLARDATAVEAKLKLTEKAGVSSASRKRHVVVGALVFLSVTVLVCFAKRLKS